MSQSQRRGRRGGHFRVLHLSDLYLRAEGSAGSVDALAALDHLLHDLQYLTDIDLVVVSGDVALDGSSSAYAAARRRIGRFAEDHDVPHVYAAGDHDHRGSFADVLGSGHLSSDGLDIGDPAVAGEERAAVSEVDGLRIVTLDSLVPDAFHGHLSERQLSWLRDLLAEPAESGTLVVLHHPPLFLDHHAQQPVSALSNAHALGEVIAGSDVRAVLCGHFMTQLSGLLDGVPVWVTPAVAHRIDLTAPQHLERIVRGGGATVLDLGGPFSPRVHVLTARDPRTGEQVSLVDGVSGRPVAAESARREMASTTARPPAPATPAADEPPAAPLPVPVPVSAELSGVPEPEVGPLRTVRRAATMSAEVLGDPADAPSLERLEATGWVPPAWARDAWARWDDTHAPDRPAEPGDESTQSEEQTEARSEAP